MAEEVGELYGFAATVIPQVQNCSSVAGDILFKCVDMFKTEVYLPDWKKCVGALESQFTCMGVSCSQVGDLKTGLAVAGTEGDAWTCGDLGKAFAKEYLGGGGGGAGHLSVSIFATFISAFITALFFIV